MEGIFSKIGMFSVFTLILYILWKVYGYYDGYDETRYKVDEEDDDIDI